ncbi:hypothetical protein IKA92_01315 [bacterium]|nr:hypothetical protein [bacterium]
MKKFFILLFLLMLPNAFAESISGGIVQNTVDDRFFGNWIVRGEIVGQAPKEFKLSTSQIWNLWKNNGVIVLENRLSGARGEVKVNEAFIGSNGAFLKFTNTDKKDLGGGETIELIETPEITLKDDSFEGIDKFEVKKYKNGALYSQKVVKYQIIGKRFREY